MTSCQTPTDTIAIHGMDRDTFLDFRDYAVDPAAVAAFRADKVSALVGEKIASRYGWQKGRRVTIPELGDFTFTVAGVFSAHGSKDDYILVMDRKYLQESAGAQGLSHYVLVRLKPGSDATAVSRAIDALPMTVQTTAQPERVFLLTVLDQLADLVRVSRAVIVMIVLIVLIAVGNSIAMSTRDRSAEFGILRTLGFPKRTIAAMVVGEGVLQAAAASVLGCIAVQAVIDARLLKTVSACGLSINLSVGLHEWAVAVATVTVAAALGCLVPAVSAAGADIVTSIRRED